MLTPPAGTPSFAASAAVAVKPVATTLRHVALGPSAGSVLFTTACRPQLATVAPGSARQSQPNQSTASPVAAFMKRFPIAARTVAMMPSTCSAV